VSSNGESEPIAIEPDTAHRPAPGPMIAPVSDEGAVGAGFARPTTIGDQRRRQRLPASPHASRFRIAMGALVGLGIGALAVAAFAASAGRHIYTPQKWSAWSPPDTGALAARDIADFIAPFYRLSAVDQLAVVTVVNLESAAAVQAAAQNGTTAPTNGLVVAVRPSPSSTALSLLGGNTIAYNLCGVGGPNCAIGIGKPSTSRLLLLRREALELALYTFKYVSGTTNVVAILPPGHSVSTSTSKLTKTLPSAISSSSSSSSSKAGTPVDVAVLFERQVLAPLLSHPLVDSLPEQVPPTVAQMPSAPEAGLVDQVTARWLFSEQLQTAQDGTKLIVLNPLPPS